MTTCLACATKTKHFHGLFQEVGPERLISSHEGYLYFSRAKVAKWGQRALPGSQPPFFFFKRTWCYQALLLTCWNDLCSALFAVYSPAFSVSECYKRTTLLGFPLAVTLPHLLSVSSPSLCVSHSWSPCSSSSVEGRPCPWCTLLAWLFEILMSGKNRSVMSLELEVFMCLVWCSVCVCFCVCCVRCHLCDGVWWQNDATKHPTCDDLNKLVITPLLAY